MTPPGLVLGVVQRVSLLECVACVIVTKLLLTHSSRGYGVVAL